MQYPKKYLVLNQRRPSAMRYKSHKTLKKQKSI